MAFTFTVEDGTGLSTSNAYISISTADDYHSGRGNSEWDKAANTDQLKQEAIVRATDYVEKRFGTRFRGKRSSKEQALSWPRMSAWDDDGYEFDDIPVKLTQAVAEYALRAISVHELSPDPPSPVQAQSHVEGVTRDTTPTGGVKKTKEVIGPIEEETEYMKGENDLSVASVSVKSSLVSDYNIPEYPAADMLLHGLLTNTSSRRVVRG